MIQYIEFRMFVDLDEEQAMHLQKRKSNLDISVELPRVRNAPLQVVNVRVDVPSLLAAGEYEENLSIGNVSSFITKIQQYICNWYYIRPEQVLHINQLPYCIVDKLTIGQNVFLGNRIFYYEDIPKTEFIRYQSDSRWVYHLGPKADFLTAFHGQGKKLFQLTDSFAKSDYTRNIRISEGIFSYRFDLTREQMTKISQKRLLHELIDDVKLYGLLKEWANKLPKMPMFYSMEEIKLYIRSTQTSIRNKERLLRFLHLFLTCGYEGCKQYYSPASFSRNYSDLKKLLAVPAILLAEHNDHVLFLQPYREWLADSRQGRGEAELVPALTSGF
ncbi:hypothetical protein NSQ24_25855 [Brevibacillus sp. FSL L8-0520]|uniref:hypothetical protein n=1 Tax=Brevibacillus TaxID=55080 RepID=UPI0030CEBA96